VSAPGTGKPARAGAASSSITRAPGTDSRWIRDGLPGSALSALTTWVWTGSAYVVPSAMAKAAVHSMTMSLAVEWAKHGIRVNAMAPGPIPTDYVRARDADAAGRRMSRHVHSYAEAVMEVEDRTSIEVPEN
jgi:NAD(P)-dependent dehydrogenase (short-subunit alcohol dehydrogenase family)